VPKIISKISFDRIRMSEKIQKQLDILGTKKSFFGKSNVEDHLKALEEIGDVGSPFDGQYICRYVFSLS